MILELHSNTIITIINNFTLPFIHDCIIHQISFIDLIVRATLETSHLFELIFLPISNRTLLLQIHLIPQPPDRFLTTRRNMSDFICMTGMVRIHRFHFSFICLFNPLFQFISFIICINQIFFFLFYFCT